MKAPNSSTQNSAKSFTQELDKLQSKWSELKGHERQVLIGLAWLLALSLVWALIWRPLAFITNAQNASESLVFEELQSMKSKAQEAQTLMAKPQLSATDAQTALNKITQSLLPQAQVSAMGQAISVTVPMVQATDLANWISRIRQDAQCQITEATMNRALTNQNGVFWSARIVLSLPKNH